MSNEQRRDCPVCHLERNRDQDQPVKGAADHGEILNVECDRCGRFAIHASAARSAEREGIAQSLSSWLRTRAADTLRSEPINRERLSEIASLFPHFSVQEKQLLLMSHFERQSNFPGERVPISSAIDFPVIWASSEQEFNYHLRSLFERKLIVSFADGIIIQPDGWDFLERNRRSKAIGRQAFVAMSFSKALLPAWQNGIKSGIERAGCEPFRTDASPDIDRIDARIISEIRRSRFVVADVTEQRPGVYFEAGFAIGLNIPVFWSVQESDLKNVHFDTRQYNHIVWITPDDLANQLYYRVEAILGLQSPSRAA